MECINLTIKPHESNHSSVYQYIKPYTHMFAINPYNSTKAAMSFDRRLLLELQLCI